MELSPQFVILGAGVVGLTTALELKDRHPDAAFTIVAKHIPGDKSVEFTSPWAGANWQSSATDNGPQEARDAVTWHKFQSLLKSNPECGLTPMECRILRTKPIEESGVLSKGTGKIWYEDLVGPFKYLEGEDLKGALWGYDMNSFVIDVPIYLNWLFNETQKRGVKLRRAKISDIREVLTSYPDAKAVFNCTGLGSYFLKGVEDKALYPTRGQILLVETPKTPLKRMYVKAPMRLAPEPTYVFPRNPGGGVILGGCMLDGVWDDKVDEDLVEDIKKRCCDLAPELGRPEDLKLLSVGVGLRPSRKGGARVEKEIYDGKNVVIHNYGAGGAGYQASWGLAKDAVDLIRDLSRL